MNPLTDSVPPAHTTNVDMRPGTVTEADAWGRAAQLLEGAAKHLHRTADIIEGFGWGRMGRAGLIRGRAHTTESDAAWCRGHADVLLGEQRRIAEARSPQVEPSTQGEGSGLPPGPPPAPVGSVPPPTATDPTDDLIPDWVQDFAAECRAEPGVWFLAAYETDGGVLALHRQLRCLGLRVEWEPMPDGSWRVEARA